MTLLPSFKKEVVSETFEDVLKKHGYKEGYYYTGSESRIWTVYRSESGANIALSNYGRKYAVMDIMNIKGYKQIKLYAPQQLEEQLQLIKQNMKT